MVIEVLDTPSKKRNSYIVKLSRSVLLTLYFLENIMAILVLRRKHLSESGSFPSGLRYHITRPSQPEVTRKPRKILAD